MPVTAVLHNMRHPTVDNNTQFRSWDEQVNGFGLYRTQADGTVCLLIARVRFPDNPLASVITPSDTMTLSGSILGVAVFPIFFQPSFRARRSILVTGDPVVVDLEDWYVTQIWEIAELKNNSREVITDPDGTKKLGGTFEGDIIGPVNSEDAQGRKATHRWEIDMLDIIQTSFWSFDDESSDAVLGAPAEEDNDLPVPNNQVSLFQEHAFLSGDPNNPQRLYWSKRFRPESFPVENFIDIGTANSAIQTHFPIAGVLGVFTTETKYRVTGNDTTGFIADEAVTHRGTPSPRSAVSTDKGVFFVARDGVFITNLVSADTKVSDAINCLFLTETKNEYAPINWAAANQIVGGYYKEKYYFSYPSGMSTVNDMTAIYANNTESWTFWNVGFGSFHTEGDSNLFLAGGITDGIVRIIEDVEATQDLATTDIALELQTQDYTGSTATTRNLFLYYKVDAECTIDSMTAQFFVDNVLVQSHTITGSRTNQLLRLPENTIGHKWRIRVTYTGHRRAAIYGATSIFVPLMAA